MKPEDLFKYHWKAYETVEYVNSRTNTVIQCALLAVDFDCHTMRIVPIADIGYEEKEFWISIELVRKIVKNQKLKLTK